MLTNKSFLLVAAVFSLSACQMSEREHPYQPPEGMVPNKETAEAIAEVVLVSIYGKDLIASEKPFETTLQNGVWHVAGTLPKRAEGFVSVGGIAEIDIAKKSGCILRVHHGE
jgi:NTF2 fold immunity protein